MPCRRRPAQPNEPSTGRTSAPLRRMALWGLTPQRAIYLDYPLEGLEELRKLGHELPHGKNDYLLLLGLWRHALPLVGAL